MNTPDTYFDLFVGFSIVWLLIALFVYQLRSEQRSLARRIDELEGRK